MCSCDGLLRYVIFIFNFFFFITGVALISMGAYVQFYMSNYFNFLSDAYLNSSVLFIAIGVVILVVGFCGCCGACTENYCMIFTFATLLAIVVIVEIAVGIVLYIYDDEVEQLIQAKMIDGLQNYSTNSSSEYAGMSDAWNNIQNDFNCCGVSNYTNWEAATNFEAQHPFSVPDSCCVDETPGCGEGALTRGGDLNPNGTLIIHTQGCLTKFVGVIEKNITLFGGIIVGIVLLQILGVLISCMLASNMRKRANYV